MKKGFKVLLAASLGSCFLAMTSYAGGWQADGANWRYQNDDASYAAGGWVAIGGNWYYFEADGLMKTGWILDNQSWYYLNPSGEMRMEPLFENQVTYYFDSASGACTNPDAANTAQAAGSGVLTEQQYLDRFDEFGKRLADISGRVESIDYGDVEAAKQVLNEMKTLFIQFAEVQAPARFAQAHERYKNGCAAMVDQLDITIQMNDTTDIYELSEGIISAAEAQKKAEEEFEAGDALLNAALQY